MPPKGMGHGMPGSNQRPAGGTLAVVIAAPDALATSGTSLEVLSRWLADPSGPLASVLVPDLARELSVVRLPREPRDFLEIRLEAELGVNPEDLLGRLLGALAAATGGPNDAEVSAIQRAWEGERALNDQRLHYAAVFYGEALASGRGALAESVAPSAMTAAEVRAAAAELLADVNSRARAAWLGDGGPEGRTELPAAVALAAREESRSDSSRRH